jgi:NADPH:quinone reductase-like Zn-dependent oxidoreductase
VKALVINEFGGPEVLRMAVLAKPGPGLEEVRVKVEAIAVARTKDVSARAGKPPFGPQIKDFPHVLGTEHAGIVDAVGAGADPSLAGQRVAVSAVLTCGQCRACDRGRDEACDSFGLLGVHRPGSYAEYVVVSARNVYVLPDDVSFTDAAAIAANGPVARAQLDAGDVGQDSVVLVIGAGGSLGSTAACLAAHRGGRVIGVDRLSVHPSSLDGLPLAASIDGDSPTLTEDIRQAAGTWGIDCVIDNIGMPAVWEAYRPSVADLGRIIVAGAINHDPLPVRLLPFYLRSQSLIGVRTGNRSQVVAMWRDVRDGYRPPQSHVHVVPWQDAVAAHRRVEEGVANGQTVLQVS